MRKFAEKQDKEPAAAVPKCARFEWLQKAFKKGQQVTLDDVLEAPHGWRRFPEARGHYLISTELIPWIGIDRFDVCVRPRPTLLHSPPHPHRRHRGSGCGPLWGADRPSR